MIEFVRFQSPIGPLAVLAIKEGVVKISFESESPEKMERWCLSHLGNKAIEGTNFTTGTKNQILNYLSGKTQSLDFPVVHVNTPFRKRVLEVERKIPYGYTRSYREVAQMVNSPRAYRAVGSANAENPLPLYFPCHRIINANGTLGRFGGGLGVKCFLLDLESRHY